MHPMGFAAWFGMLATALNLFPIGQLDGGHISYSVLGPRWSTIVTFATITVAAGLAFFATSWVVWIVLMIDAVRLRAPHPRVFDEHVPLDRTRLWLALFALVMFILCFTPAPIRPMEIIAR
jgi:membrane-associated protease RseP (regulator of RpoE activity)